MASTRNPEITPEPKYKQVKCVKIKADSITEVVNREEDEDWKGMGSRHGWSLPLAETWQFKKYRLSMITLGYFSESDYDNMPATLLYNQMRKNGNQTIIQGPVFISNEDGEKTIDITVDEVKEVISQAAFLYKREHMT